MNKRSGIAEEVTELDRLLSEVVSIIDDINEEKEAVRKAEQLKKEAQKKTNQFVLECAEKRSCERKSFSRCKKRKINTRGSDEC